MKLIVVTRIKSIQLANSDVCTGCGACASVCPQKCIKMVEGIQGHLLPKIDDSKCVSCGLCTNSCAVLHSDELKPILRAYACWTKDENDYKTTASGGIATALARYVIGQNGIVYGCAMLPDVEVKHIRVDGSDKLDLLKSSKYVQSSLVDVFPKIKNDVHDGRMVLFVGTPCQVAAIKRIFPLQPDNLFLVDLICHGVPSLKALRGHVKKVARGVKVEKVVFRENGNNYVFAVYDGEGVAYKMPLWPNKYRDWYVNSFFDGYTFRDSCYQCRYARPERCSDMTIGDFWGLNDNSGELPSHSFGCSVALPITPKGESLLAAIRSTVNFYEREVCEAVEGNTQLRVPTKLTKRIRFYRKAQKIAPSHWVYYLVNLDRIVKLYCGKVRRKLVAKTNH